MSRSIEKVLSKLNVATHLTQDKVMAHCPCHKDDTASLCITHENGKTLLNCFAGCKPEDIVSSIGLTMLDLYDEPLQDETKKQKSESGQRCIEKFNEYAADSNNKVDEVYDYYSLDGSYHHTKIRYEDKKFLAGTKQSDGSFVFGNIEKSKPSVYGDISKIPETVEKGEHIFIVEGEKDVNTMSRQGFLAFTTGGTSSWNSELSELFKGADVIILCDNDKFGKKYALMVYDDVKNVAKSVKVLNPMPDTPKGDISDFFEQKKSYTLFQELVASNDQYDQIAQELEKSQKKNDGPEWMKQLEYNHDREGNPTTIKDIIANVVLILENDEDFAGCLAYNDFSHKEGYIKALPWTDNEFGIWSDHDTRNVRMILEKNYKISKQSVVEDGIHIAMMKNKYNPLIDLLRTFEYKGDGFIKEIVTDYLGVEESDIDYAVAALRITMLGALHRLFKPGCKFDTVLMLKGSQGFGKSTFIRKLALDSKYFNDSLTNMDTKEAVIAIQDAWIVELAELATFTRTLSGVDGIKSFITTQVDKTRLPYNKYAEEFPRHCIFIGTTNKADFLMDSTGNRRFVVLKVSDELAKKKIWNTEIGFEELIQNAWAEMLHFYDEHSDKIGKYLVIPKEFETRAEELRKQCESADPMLPVVEKYLDGKDRTCVMDVWENCFAKRNGDGDIIDSKPERKLSTRISSILQQLDFEAGNPTNFGGYKNVRVYHLKKHIKQAEEPIREETQIELDCER